MVIDMSNKFFMSKYWLDWIFPNRCPICKKVIVWNELICTDCNKKLPIRNNFSVTDKLQSLDLVCSAFKYKGNAVRGIYSLKNNKGINFAEYSSKLLADFISENQIDEQIDLITCVPMSRKKQRMRGYNQAQIIAKFMSRNLNKPYDFNLILHTNSKTEQHKLTSKERMSNAYKSFIPNAKHPDINGRNILICDDVITTGATMQRCTELLKCMGANKIFACSICTTDNKNMDHL